MTELEAMFTEGFAEVERVFRPTTGAITITGSGAFSAVVKSCIFSEIDKGRAMQETGFVPNWDAVAEILRTEAAELGLYPLETSGKRPQCTVAGTVYKRVGMKDDKHDLFVRMHLELSQ